jgi:hypothetical protein
MESAGRDPAYVKAMLGRRGTTTPAVNRSRWFRQHPQSCSLRCDLGPHAHAGILRVNARYNFQLKGISS